MLKKSIITVILAAVVMLAAGAAQADIITGLTSSQTPALAAQAASPTRLYVNPGGLGDALVYGYYNTRSAINFFRIVNTSETTGVAVKIRFREGKWSAETLDYFICLSAADEYSGFIIGNGANKAASVYSYDSDTPTYPSLAFLGKFDMAYGDPYSAVTADQTNEGYYEVIGINAWPDTPGTGKVVKTSDTCLCVATAGSQGTGCANINYNNDAPNSLAGTHFIWNIESATSMSSYAYNAEPIAYCRINPVTNAGLGADDHPRLDDCQPRTAANGLTEVNFAETKTHLHGLYDIQNVFGGATTYIVTFPTKRLSIANFGDSAPFDGRIEVTNGQQTGRIIDGATSADHCETINVKLYDDEEKSPGSTVGVSPPKRSGHIELCDEVNLIVVGNTADPLVTSSLVQFNVNVEGAGFDYGWMKISLNAEAQSTTIVDAANTWVASGLPAIAFELQDFDLSTITMSPAMLPMKYSVEVTLNGAAQNVN